MSGTASRRPKKNHNWVEDGTDIQGDKDYKCSDCGIWASRVLSPWLLGGCLGKPVENKLEDSNA